MNADRIEQDNEVYDTKKLALVGVVQRRVWMNRLNVRTAVCFLFKCEETPRCSRGIRLSTLLFDSSKYVCRSAFLFSPNHTTHTSYNTPHSMIAISIFLNFYTLLGPRNCYCTGRIMLRMCLTTKQTRESSKHTFRVDDLLVPKRIHRGSGHETCDDSVLQ